MGCISASSPPGSVLDGLTVLPMTPEGSGILVGRRSLIPDGVMYIGQKIVVGFL